MAVIGYYENQQLVDDTLAQVEGVIVTKRERNANVASAMYKALINDGIVLVSDNSIPRWENLVGTYGA
ncbi:hypothetical protein [Pectobacterium quasiaquaticum]|uniref:hypothetical protein n=1 Tax=Pectobacterium quasiaquaticum TaxID=2774015 RepID=UPI001CF7D7F6|nr:MULTISPECIES: hypothetical protein [Pectobacterium]